MGGTTLTSPGHAVLFLAIYLFAVLLTAGVVFLVRRRLPALLLSLLALAPLLFVGRGAFTNETLLPVDHAMLIPPWNTHPEIQRHNPYLNDIALQFLPWAKLVRQAWAHGALPLHDRWNGAGMPLAANGQSAAFSPLVFLSGPLPILAAFSLMAALKLFLTLTGMWLWLKELRVSSPAALFGSVTFSLSLTMLAWLFTPLTSVECLWPWSLFALELLRDRAVERRAFWLLVAVLTALPLGGHIESAAFGCLFAAVWVAARWICGDFPEAPRVAARTAAASLLAAGLTAFSVLPQAFAILSSNRIVLAREPFWSRSFSWIPHGPVWPGAALTTVLPRALGDEMGSPAVAGAAGSFLEMALGYIGVVGLTCALMIFRPGASRRRPAWILLGLAVGGFGAATALWPFAEIVGHVPVLKFVFPLRFLTWVALAGSVLAALELERFVADLQASRRAFLGAIVVVGAVALLAALVYEHQAPLHAASGGLRSQQKWFWLAQATLAALAVMVGFTGWRGGKVPGLLPYGLALLGGAELWIQGASLYRTGRVAHLFPPTPLIQFLQSRPSPFRVVGEGAALFPNSNVFAGVEEVRTHDPVERRDYVEFLDATCGYPPGEYFKLLGNLNATALDFLNVRYLVAAAGRAPPAGKWSFVYGGPDGTVFENRDVLPRVFAPAQVTMIAGAESRWGWVRNAFARFGAPASALATKKDWREHAFVLGRASRTFANGNVRVLGYLESANAVALRTVVGAGEPEAYLVTSVTQDGGWSARDEAGRWVETTLANGPFLAIRAPRGAHVIRLTYSSPGFRIGAWIAGACALAIVLAAGRASARRLLGRRLSRSTERTASAEGRMLWIWLLGAAAILIAGVSSSRLLSSSAPLRIPATPLDLTSDRFARMWSFLREIRGRVPDGASYTVLADDPNDAMFVYMISLGIFERQQALPTTYYGDAFPQGSGARYVLSYGEEPPEPPDARLVVRTRLGAVYERVRR